ncbi:sialate O-acetylesterase [Bradyrhizobium sp. HKCCYLRH2060]|uniref:sialate O-acetylesterase n=1 Tax=Bradyrhizobium TaxID=374 RepID=UPI002916AFAB|nr:sialate O-acetylesterase [Bradyrhizobium sp. SZCCHNR3003]
MAPFDRYDVVRSSIVLVGLLVVWIGARAVTSETTLRDLRDISAALADVRAQQARLAQASDQQQALLLKLEALQSDQLLSDMRTPAYSAEGAALFAKALKVDCRTFARTRSAVILILGQSNGGNYGEGRSPNRHDADLANYFSQQCAVAAEPLMGSDGNGGSPWIALANTMLQAKVFDRVLLVPVTLGGSGMTRWSAGGDLYMLAESTLRRLARSGIPPTHVFWVQGEAERFDDSRYRRNGGADYFDGLQAIVNLVRRYSQAKVFVSPTSSCRGEQRGPAPEIRWAQTEIVKENSGVVFSGPDLDAIDLPEQRTDTCHLSQAGMKAFVSGWHAAIQAAEPAAR